MTWCLANFRAAVLVPEGVKPSPVLQKIRMVEENTFPHTSSPKHKPSLSFPGAIPGRFGATHGAAALAGGSTTSHNSFNRKLQLQVTQLIDAYATFIVQIFTHVGCHFSGKDDKSGARF